MQEQSRVKLGDTVRDHLTGFTGIATAKSEHLFGCIRVMVEPTKLKDGAPQEPVWLDEARLEVTEKGTMAPIGIMGLSVAGHPGGPWSPTPPPTRDPK